ncbi:MAG: hypothetical protein ACPG8A_06880 [Psychrobium sp.]
MKRLVVLGIVLIIGVVSTQGTAVANDKTIQISKVESAVVSSIRQLSEQDLERDKNRNWALFGKSLLGGVLGYQYGNGSGHDIKSVLNTILAHNQEKDEGNELKSSNKVRLTELQVRLNNGKRQAIILATQNDRVYRANDKVRLVYFETGVFIDKI